MPESPENPSAPPVLYAVPIESIQGEDETDTKLLREMAAEAVRYVRRFEWCRELHDCYFTDGFGGVVALFLFRVTIRNYTKPEWVWIIVGDLPSVYLEFEGFENPRAALLRYIEGTEEWLGSSPDERDSGEIIPINVPSDPQLIEMLRRRIEVLRSSILPHIRES